MFNVLQNNSAIYAKHLLSILRFFVSSLSAWRNVQVAVHYREINFASEFLAAVFYFDCSSARFAFRKFNLSTQWTGLVFIHSRIYASDIREKEGTQREKSQKKIVMRKM